MWGHQLEAETRQPGPGVTDQLGDTSGLEVEQTSADMQAGCRRRDVGGGNTLDSHLTPS